MEYFAVSGWSSVKDLQADGIAGGEKGTKAVGFIPLAGWVPE